MGGMIQIVSTGTSGMGQKPQSMRAQSRLHTQESCSGCLCLWTVGASPLNSPAVVNFCFYIFPTFFLPPPLFKSKKKKKSVVVRIKTEVSSLPFKTLQGWRKPVRTDRPLGGVRGWLRNLGDPLDPGICTIWGRATLLVGWIRGSGWGSHR